MKPGDIVIVNFAGVTGVKRRPAVVVSTKNYHLHRPDIIGNGYLHKLYIEQ